MDSSYQPVKDPETQEEELPPPRRGERWILGFLISLPLLFILIATLFGGDRTKKVVTYTGEILAHAQEQLIGATSEVVRLETRLEKVQSLYGIGDYEGRSWLDHVLALDDEGLAPATKAVQKQLYEWQNPPLEECASKEYYILNLTGSARFHEESQSLGSTIHLITWSFRNALDTGRILTYDTTAFGRAFVDESCRVDGIRSPHCIFEPLTHCPHSAVTVENSIVGFIKTPPPSAPKLKAGGFGAVPLMFKQLLNDTLPYEQTKAAAKYWWRTQATAYLMRLSKASLAHIVETRLNQTSHYAFTRPLKQQGVAPFAMPFPLPGGVSSLQVSHADKAREKSLSPLKSYVQQVEKLASLNPNAYARMAFLSSKDPQVFVEAEKIKSLSTSKTTPNERWIWFTSHIGRINGSSSSQVDAFGNKTETTLSWMSETMLALECDAFVGTRGSNWNRVIDELRCTWMDKCSSPFMDVGTEEDWSEYDW